MANFDFDGARAAGYSSDEIFRHLATLGGAPADPAAAEGRDRRLRRMVDDATFRTSMRDQRTPEDISALFAGGVPTRTLLDRAQQAPVVQQSPAPAPFRPDFKSGPLGAVNPEVGAETVAEGWKQLWEPSDTTAADPTWWDTKAAGASKVLRGGMQLAAPAMLPAAAAAPVATLGGLAGGAAASYGTGKAAEAAGVPPGQADLLSDVAGLAGGTLGAHLQPETVARAGEAAKSFALDTEGSMPRGSGKPAYDVDVANLNDAGPFQKPSSTFGGWNDNTRALRSMVEKYYPAEEASQRWNETLDYLGQIGANSAGKGALRPNTKTFMSIDVTGKCPLTADGVPCLQCYVEAPRVQNQKFLESGAMKEGQNFAKASSDYDQAPYNGEILGMPDHLVDYFNEQGGIRMFSAGDYRPQDAPILDRILRDASARRLNVKAITKSPEFVERYGDLPNLRINVSTDFLPDHAALLANGNPKLEAVIADPSGNRLVSNGMRIDDAVALKDRYRDVRVRYVAMNPQDGIAAVADPRLDVVTMYHGPVNTTGKLMEIWRRMRPDVFRNLGESTVKSLADSFAETRNVGDWPAKVTQQQLDNVLGPGAMDPAEFKDLARRKLCCQSGKCASSGAKCGYGIHGEE